MVRIKKNEYHIPSRTGPLARNLIQRLLQHEPTKVGTTDLDWILEQLVTY